MTCLAALALLAPLTAPASPQAPLVFEPIVATSAGLTSPIGFAALPGDDRLFVVELGGLVKILAGGAVQPTPFLDASPHIVANALTGLRAIEFHPDYDTNGFVYVWHDAADPMSTALIDIVCARFTRSVGSPDMVDPASYVEIFRTDQDTRGHGGGSLHFGPDGMLYIGLGDGGLQEDPNCRSQDLSQHMGSILRVDVDGAFPYAIPPDNPFVSVPGAQPEIAHYGMRHHWKWSFDRDRGDLWIADVGGALREEVSFIRAGQLGRNLGWKTLEGTVCKNADHCGQVVDPCAASSYTRPVFEYEHSLGCSITGGFVYRGTAIPGLVGAYVCGDYCTGRLWSLRFDGVALTELLERDAVFPTGEPGFTGLVAFGEDGHSELVCADLGTGRIFRLVAECGALATCEGALNSVGLRGSLRFSGSTDLGSNNAAFAVDSLPPQTTVVLFYGPEAGDEMLGNGTLCIGGGTVGLFRVGVEGATATGNAAFSLDLASLPFSGGPGQVTAGSTWFFQAWYRDVGGPLGAPSNLSGGVALTFCP